VFKKVVDRDANKIKDFHESTVFFMIQFDPLRPA
jgi:hypothetical protein